MMSRFAAWLLPAVLLGHTFASPQPLYYEPDVHPLAVVSELGQRLASHSRLQEAGESRLNLPSRLEPVDSILGLSSRLEPSDSRLGLPTPQEIDAIKKVAQILVMLGEQVIPTIIADIAPPAPAHSTSEAVPAEEVPNDPVNQNLQ